VKAGFHIKASGWKPYDFCEIIRACILSDNLNIQMADSFNKKDREKRKRKRKKEKAERKERRRQEGGSTEEFMYVDADGNLTSTPPDPTKKRKVKLEDIMISTPKKEESDENEFTRKGFVKFFNTDKGYGFIIEQDSQESYFVHIDNVNEEIRTSDKVEFEIGSGPKGPIALNVRILQ
jgi:cold shock CspA family protein